MKDKEYPRTSVDDGCTLLWKNLHKGGLQQRTTENVAGDNLLEY